jgi:ATP-dependent Lhr-like helicase
MAVLPTARWPHYTGRVPHETSSLEFFHAPVRAWFESNAWEPTAAQRLGWPPILEGKSTLLLAPTGSGKTLAAFLGALDRLMFSPEPARAERLRLLYVSPLKALGVDIERNLRAPVAGIAEEAARHGVTCRVPRVAIRSGDTPAAERARFARTPSDILITTPESLYLLLTSEARRTLAFVETVVVDEIHALSDNKRGAHLFLSLERLEALRAPGRPLQRIGLSATQRPLERVARLLGGGEVREPDRIWTARPVTVVDAGASKQLSVSVEWPSEAPPTADQRVAARGTISRWPAIDARILELVRGHRSTLVFVNNRRLAERVATSLNELSGREIALAHHGSLAKERRLEVEQRLKRGELCAVVATSSLELGIDMGAVDLVVQIETPPSVASGLQRVGRAGHAVGAESRGVCLPKFRGDLLSAAAITGAMQARLVEETAYPEVPLDVLAQQMVAMVSVEAWPVDALFDRVRQAAPFAELPESAFTGVLDLLSGRYPSDEFSGLVPRVTWDRKKGIVQPRQGARSIAIANGGTIADRGLYSVFWPQGDRALRVGELDEEMVFESRPGDVFLLGASSWRIQEITHDRVTVTPAPGEPGKMPFWHGDRPGRRLGLGRLIGELTRELMALPDEGACSRLVTHHGLDRAAAEELVRYLRDQVETAGAAPTDRTILLERFVDDIGDLRVCLLSPFGARVHAPWALAITARLRELAAGEVDAVWSDDGIALRLPQGSEPPSPSLLAPGPDEVRDLVVGALGTSSVFAARFRENAQRALLLPRRRPGRRSPLWAQRKRASDLLSVAARYPSFPILLETHRECLRDLFDLGGLRDILGKIARSEIELRVVDSRVPSPFTNSLLFSYVANFIYEGDAPLAERRAHALGLDQQQLRELLGEAELRNLLDPEIIALTEQRLQRIPAADPGVRPVRHRDALHDLLLALGDQGLDEIEARSDPHDRARGWLGELLGEGRAIEVAVGGLERYAAVEDAARLRDAVGVELPPGLPAALLDPVLDPLGDLVSRYARTHGPFTAGAVAARFGVELGRVEEALAELGRAGRIVEGEFLPERSGREWCDREVLGLLRRQSLSKLRHEVEPVDEEALGRLLVDWHGLRDPEPGPDTLIRAIERLEGAALPASALFGDLLPARVRDFSPRDLDHLCARGEVVWRGVERTGSGDGRIAIYLTERYRLLAPPTGLATGPLAAKVREILRTRGALFWHDLRAAIDAFFPELLAALWELVWAGEVTNDTVSSLVSLFNPGPPRRLSAGLTGIIRRGPPGSEGRWSLLPRIDPDQVSPSETDRRVALTQALLRRHGILTREALRVEYVPQGFSAIYPILKTLEDGGRVRRGYFVSGLGATQFAAPGADDRLRSLRGRSASPDAFWLAATDPANPYGGALDWPAAEPRLQRVAGAHVLLWDGALVAYLARGEANLRTFLPSNEPEQTRAARSLAETLGSFVDGGRRPALFISSIDGKPSDASPLGRHLVDAGFVATSRGHMKRGRGRRS